MNTTSVIGLATTPSFTAIANIFGVAAGMWMAFQLARSALKFGNDTVRKGIVVAIERSRRRSYIASYISARDLHFYISYLATDIFRFFLALAGALFATLDAKLPAIKGAPLSSLSLSVEWRYIVSVAFTLVFTAFAANAMFSFLTLNRNVRRFRRKWMARKMRQ